ncbi:hypothetical protein ACROYT_G019038, partial [Oculina patagonica]
AKQRVLQAGGDPSDTERVLSISSLQFGKYQGKSFQWLLQNDMSWTTMVMADYINCGKNPTDHRISNGTVRKPFIVTHPGGQLDLLKNSVANAREGTIAG